MDSCRNFFNRGDVHESEVWADLSVTQGAFRRGASASIAIVQMEENASITDLGVTLELDPRLDLKVQGELIFTKSNLLEPQV